MKTEITFDEKRGCCLQLIPESSKEELELLQLGDFLKETWDIKIDITRSIDQAEICFS